MGPNSDSLNLKFLWPRGAADGEGQLLDTRRAHQGPLAARSGDPPGGAVARAGVPTDPPAGKFSEFQAAEGAGRSAWNRAPELRHVVPSRGLRAAPGNPPAYIVRNIARLFGFAPPSGADDTATWSAWWSERWPSFTPRETHEKTAAPAEAFKAQYRAALAAGTLKFLPPVPMPQRKKAVPARPSAAQAQEMADLIDRLLAQVAEVPRLGNMVGSVLEGPLHRLRDLPDQSRWDETDFDQLLYCTGSAPCGVSPRRCG